MFQVEWLSITDLKPVITLWTNISSKLRKAYENYNHYQDFPETPSMSYHDIFKRNRLPPCDQENPFGQRTPYISMTAHRNQY